MQTTRQVIGTRSRLTVWASATTSCKTHMYLRQLYDAGVKFKSFTEQYIDSLGIFGDAIIGILAAMAQQERVRISDRTKAGIERNKAKGKTWKRGPNRKYKAGKPSRTTLWQRQKELHTQGLFNT